MFRSFKHETKMEELPAGGKTLWMLSDMNEKEKGRI